MLCGCIDIGSNTTRLLVADVRDGAISALVEEKAYTELGRDLRATGVVSSRRMRHLADVVAGYRRELTERGVGRVRAVGTAALRGAGNREAVLACVREHARMEPDVLSAAEEARLAFLGATHARSRAPAPGRLAVVDVGGGSSEIAVGVPGKGVSWSCSLPVGSGLMAEAHAYDDPPTPAQMAAMREHLRDAFATTDVPPTAEAVAVGGSATSVCRMGAGALDRHALERAARMVCATPSHEVAARFELDVERVRLLPAGILILDAVVDRLGCALQVGRGGIREGVCLELAGEVGT